MRGLKFLPLMAMLEWTVGQNDPSAPRKKAFSMAESTLTTRTECALRCWENTKYVTKCSGDPVCLCSDPNYQNASRLPPELHH